MTITLFGGSFNPPHLGHALIIQEFLESNLTDQLWLLPAFQHAFNKSLAPATDRLNMCQLLINHLTTQNPHFSSRLKLCSLEIDHQLSGHTFDSLQLLKSKPDYLTDQKLLSSQTTTINYQFLMGSDQLPNFHLWGNQRQLLEQMTFWIYPRQGHPLKPLSPGMKAFQHEHQTITNFSSTLVRNRISNDLNASLLLPAKIHSYINRHHLYNDPIEKM